MASRTNRFGLTDYIPREIKYAVRKRCGFGCVICGHAIIHYEHVDPEFKDATEHDPEAMALLCGGCHDKVTRGQWSKEKVKRASASPKCLEKGFSFGVFDIGNDPPDIIFGGIHAVRSGTVLRIYGRDVLSVSPPEEPHGPFRISAFFADGMGEEMCVIEDNEWRVRSDMSDLTVVGQVIEVSTPASQPAMDIVVDPPRGINIYRLLMRYQDVMIFSDGKYAVVQFLPRGKQFLVAETKVFDAVVIMDVQARDRVKLGLGGRCELGLIKWQ